MLSAIAKPFGWLMLVLYNFVGNYGIALILFSLIVRLILLPFSMKSKKSLMRSTRFQPLMKDLEKKYAGNKQKYQEEVAKLYKQEGINPMSGCIWSLIPFPILLALYQAIRYPITIMMNVGDAAYKTIEATLDTLGFTSATSNAYVQIAQSQFITANFDKFSSITDKLQKLNYNFLGIDLGAQPTFKFWTFFSNGQPVWPQIGLFLIPIVSAALSYVSVLISNKAGGAQAEAAAGTKGMTLMMPLVSLWIGFVMPGALGLYWIASSLFTIIQDAILTEHYKKILDIEDADRRTRMAALEADRASKHTETEKLREQNATMTNPNTSKRKIAMKEKQKSAEKGLEWESERSTLTRTAGGKYIKSGKKAENPSAVGDRLYARGRNYKPDRFNKNYVPDDGDEDAAAVEDISTAAPEGTESITPTAADTQSLPSVFGQDAENESDAGDKPEGN